MGYIGPCRVIGSGNDLVTIQDETYYVRTTGNDNNDGLTELTAFRNPQPAIDKTAYNILHAISVDMGVGTFDNIDVTGRMFHTGGSLLMFGVLDAPTLSGATTGTGDGASDAYQIADASAGWTVNELRGKLIKINGVYRPIYSNTATVAQFVGKFGSTTLGQDYEILEQKTVLNQKFTPSVGFPTITQFSNIGCDQSESWTLRNIRIDGDTDNADQCSVVYNSVGGVFERCDFDGSGYGTLLQASRETNFRQCTLHDVSSWHGLEIVRAPSTRSFSDVFIYDNALDGCNVSGSMSFHADWFSSNGNGQNGLFVYDALFTDIDGGQFEDNSEYGLRFGELGINLSGKSVISALAPAGRLKLAGNTLGGILNEVDSTIYLSGATGSSTGFGYKGTTGAKLFFKNGVDVTGSSGDATINDGTTVLTWATHFPTNLSVAKNVDTNSIIQRID